ncbi:MAG: hypothetical protein KJO61_10985 [Deltaproteobacteria bacterium]|nr:hypothetical protein [Deltaproteobacteria bacterium]
MRTQAESRNRYVVKILIRVISNIIIFTGLVLLILVLYNAALGTLSNLVFEGSTDSSLWNVIAIGLSLPVPLHVISIGLLLQKKWLPHRWVKISWIAIILSGCWLGIALFIKLFLLK